MNKPTSTCVTLLLPHSVGKMIRTVFRRERDGFPLSQLSVSTREKALRRNGAPLNPTAAKPFLLKETRVQVAPEPRYAKSL
jgi:hypothetical protein